MFLNNIRQHYINRIAAVEAESEKIIQRAREVVDTAGLGGGVALFTLQEQLAWAFFIIIFLLLFSGLVDKVFGLVS